MQNKAENEYASLLVLVLFITCLLDKNMELHVFKEWFPDPCCLQTPDSDRIAIHEFQHILGTKAGFIIY